MVLAPEQQLQGGRFKIEKVLGQGGFGITYKAFHTLFEQPFVIKTPNDHLTYDPDYPKYVERFMREGRLLRKLCQDPHPHIVYVSDLFIEKDIPYLVMDYIEGESLMRRVMRQKKALPEAEAVTYIRQMGEALTKAHQAGIVHRDAHPDNIMLRGSGKAVLIDFGIAGEIIPRTVSSKIAANWAFAPYEQIRQKQEDCRKPTVDIYTLAASLYYAVTGEYPIPALERKYDDLELVAPKQHNPKLSERVNQLILTGMALEAKNRPQSMPEWMAWFQDEQIPARYQKLQDLLKAGKWKEADQETAKVMLQVAGREKDGWLDSESIKNFPCEDLRTIDQLWVKYSSGRFGFSVQKRIWQEVGGKEDWEIMCRFCDRIGWRRAGEWLEYSEITFSYDAPRGHLPFEGGGCFKGWMLFYKVGGAVARERGILLSRRDL